MKKTFAFIVGILICISVFSQNNPVLFGFAETPQTLLLNPGAETNYKFHIGVPVFSGFSFHLGATGATISDLFLDDGINFNTKLSNVINQLNSGNFLSLNLQIEVLNGGYRLNNNTYLTVGFYEELDFIGYFPKDLVTLLYEGNASYLNRSFYVSQVKIRAELLGVIHVGLSKKINNKLNLGGRFKLYSGSIHVNTTENSGSFTTREEGNNIYRYYLNNVDASVYTSGLFEENSLDIGSNGFLFGGNLGVGVDVGFTYHYTPQIEFTGSVLDVGFVSYSKNVKNAEIAGSYIFDGIELVYDLNNPTNYWQQLEDDFEGKVPSNENSESFTAWRPIKFNAAVKYSFGKPRRSKVCYAITHKEYFTNAVGLQLYSITRPLRNQFAMTAFFERTCLILIYCIKEIKLF